MGFFSKDNKDLQQTQEIKEAASSTPSNPPSLQPSMQATTVPEPQQQEFVNPFAQQNNSNEPTMPGNSNTQAPSFSTPEQPTIDNQSPTSPNPFAQAPTQTTTSQQQSSVSTPMNQNSLDEDKIKELIVENVEKIIDERWEKVTSNVESVVQWKDSIEREIDLLKHDIVTIKEGFEQFEKRLLNKINTYDRNILDVNSEIKALEKVFNKITPTLVNNVNELSKIADNLRGGKNDTPDQK